MSVAKAEILDAISNMSVLELSQLIKDLEDKFGVSAAAATVAAAAPAGRGGGEDRVYGRAHRVRRKQGQRDQGGPRSHRARAEGGQGPCGWSAQARQGRRVQSGLGSDFEEVDRRRRQGRDQVTTAQTILHHRAHRQHREWFRLLPVYSVISVVQEFSLRRAQTRGGGTFRAAPCPLPSGFETECP